MKLRTDERGFAGALAMLLVSLLVILLAYTYIAYPFVIILNNTVTNANLWTEESYEIFKRAVMALSVAGIITTIGLFIWLVARFTKKEKYEWLR